MNDFLAGWKVGGMPIGSNLWPDEGAFLSPGMWLTLHRGNLLAVAGFRWRRRLTRKR